MNNDQSRAILAVILSGIFLFGWQYFYGPTESENVSKVEHGKIEASNKITNQPKVIENSEIAEDEKSILSREQFNIYSKNSSYTVTSDLRFIQASNFSSKSNDYFNDEYIQLILGKEQYYKFSKKGESLEFVSQDGTISGNIDFNQNEYLSISIFSKTPVITSFVFKSKNEKLDNGQIKQFAYLDTDLRLNEVGEEFKELSSIYWAGLDFNYHLFNVVFDEKEDFKIVANNQNITKIIKTDEVSSFKFDILFTKKEYDKLASFGSNLHLAIDLGFLSLIAVPILRGLQFFYEVFPNYGIAIVLLTLVIRSLTFPLQYKSFKSMKKMQDIQPELNKIREKFKEDPQRLQQETMKIFKSAKVNPLGGCLPLVLQMPIFFAFYKVLYTSTELVDAPFYFWIHDLSEKDPYYVLPVLMSLSMFLQQKLTPSATTDPVQKKVMMFMPLIFGIFMKDLPSGLSLYIFVSTVFGMLQQLFVYKRA